MGQIIPQNVGTAVFYAWNVTVKPASGPEIKTRVQARNYDEAKRLGEAHGRVIGCSRAS